MKKKKQQQHSYLKYKKMRDEMEKLKMHGGPDDYLENLEKIKKEAGIDNLYKSYEIKSLEHKKHPEEVIKLNEIFKRSVCIKKFSTNPTQAMGTLYYNKNSTQS